MTKEERLQQLEEAMQLVEDAKAMVDEAIPEDKRAHYEAYGCYGFDQLLGTGNPYDDGINSIIEELNA